MNVRHQLSAAAISLLTLSLLACGALPAPEPQGQPAAGTLTPVPGDGGQTPTTPTTDPAPTPVTPPAPPISTAPAPTPPVSAPTPTASYPYALSLTVNQNDSVAALERTYDAKVIEFRPAEGYALLATKSNVVQVNDPVHQPKVETNKGAFNGGGMTATANGRVSLWAVGRVSLWAVGSLAPVQENTGNWNQIKLQAAQSRAVHLGQGVKVAVIDTGLDLLHPAFVGALAPKSEWRDFYDDDADPSDVGTFGTGGYGHGTNVAGIVLQIAPNATILPLRALGLDGSADVLSVVRAIDWAVAKGANVINLSLGSRERSDIIQAAIDRATKAGVAVMASVGNDGEQRLNFPAADAANGASDELTVSVGSVAPNDLKSDFSNYAKAMELVAPGEDVFGPAPGGKLAAWSGTSMSAPMASGAVALALGELDPAKTNIKDVVKALVDSADEVDKLAGNKRFEGKLGKEGRLNLLAFLNKVLGKVKGD